MLINSNSPFYVKIAYKFLIIFFVCYFINAAAGILVPFSFSILLAMMLLPLEKLFRRVGFSKIISISFSLMIIILFLVAVIYFLSAQISNFVDDIPSIKKHLSDHFISLQGWIKSNFHISFSEQNDYLKNATKKLKDSGTGYISNTFFSITETLLLLILVPIYTFLLLYYKDLISRFFYAVFPKQSGDKVSIVIKQSKIMIHNYMLGILIEMGIVTASISIGLALLGIKYAVFFGVLAGILNIVPYIGIFTATLFTILITLTTSNNSSDIVWVIAIMYGIHIIDVNIMLPKIVGSKVRINSLISLLGLVIGGALAGLAGLFLSVPALALLKIICDQVDDLKPWGMLLGDDVTPVRKNKLYHRFKNLTKKPAQKQL